jgi:hypothetical protein
MARTVAVVVVCAAIVRAAPPIACGQDATPALPTAEGIIATLGGEANARSVFLKIFSADTPSVGSGFAGPLDECPCVG